MTGHQIFYLTQIHDQLCVTILQKIIILEPDRHPKKGVPSSHTETYKQNR